MVVLVTGAAGYIGSHCVLDLIQDGVDVVLFDNLSTGFQSTIDTLFSVGSTYIKGFVNGDLRKLSDLEKVFEEYNIDSVIHFGALSQVEESMRNPELYFENNVDGTKNLLEVMVSKGVKHIVFSSTASVYGEPQYLPIDENHPKNPTNIYGETKLAVENLLDKYDEDFGIKSVRLRYFNVVGASDTGIMGENHNPETHLVPNILKAHSEKEFKLFGVDYATQDGTCVRDYIDVQDISKAHILALKYLKTNNHSDVFNLGTQVGYSVKEVFALCEKIKGQKVSLTEFPRRNGDVEKLIALNEKAKKILNWKPQVVLEDSIKNSYIWESKKA